MIGLTVDRVLSVMLLGMLPWSSFVAIVLLGLVEIAKCVIGNGA